MRPLTIETADGISLEARWDRPEGSPSGYVVFCHPHPLHGGTMTAPLMEKVTARMVESGWAVLRFNFRGVGGSEGGWGGGTAELDDVAAAMTAARAEAGDGVALAGWSFGAATALRWQARDGDTSTYVGIAPPVETSDGTRLPDPAELKPARRTIIIGERDQLIDVAAVQAYAEAIGAAFHLVPASDHFFYFREARVADLVLAGLQAD